MPIDPVQLRSRASDVAARLVGENASPPECAAAVHRLLEDYADRTRRRSPRLADSAPVNELKTPPPVVRAILTALRRPAQTAPDKARALAQLLWKRGSREERRIAAELLGLVAAQQPAEALALIEAWLPEIESGETADAVAEFALGPLLPADAFGYLQRAQAWVQQPHRWLRRFGVSVVSALAKERRWDDVPAALDLLRGLMSESDPVVRQAVAHALQDLFPRHPVEVGRFLREHAARSNHHTHAILRATLRVLPLEEQAQIIKAMRA